MRRIRVLFVHHATGRGGAPISMISIIQNLNPSKYDSEVLLLKNSQVAKMLHESGIRYTVASGWFYKYFYRYYSLTIPSEHSRRKITSHIRCAVSWVLSRSVFAIRELRKHDFDIAHLNSSVLTDWLKPCHRMGKTVIHIREPVSKGKYGIRYRFLQQQMTKYGDKIIAISQDNSNRINTPFNTEVIYNFTKIEEFPELNVESYQSRKVLYLGGASGIKGFCPLVEALDYLEDDITVLFCGKYGESYHRSGNDAILVAEQELVKESDAQKLLSKMRNHERSVEIGMVDDVNKYLDSVVCLLSPFTIPHFSRPVIEAFSRRKTSIATDIDGIQEMITDGYNGVLVRANDACALGNAINQLCNDPHTAKKLGDNGYFTAKKKFSEKNVQRLEAIYSELLNI